MRRHAAHRDGARRHARRARSARCRGTAAGDLGVLEEQLEEIAHPIEEQAILRPRPSSARYCAIIGVGGCGGHWLAALANPVMRDQHPRHGSLQEKSRMAGSPSRSARSCTIRGGGGNLSYSAHCGRGTAPKVEANHGDDDDRAGRSNVAIFGARRRCSSTPRGGRGKIEIIASKPMATQRDLSARLFARRRRAGARHRRGSGRPPMIIPPRAIWSR